MKGTNMKIYIDFDGTLFNTDRYINDFIRIFNEYGINKSKFDNVKKTLFNDKELFNINAIIDYFINKYNIDYELKNKINLLLNNSYVFYDVVDSLKNLINFGYELCLLSYGDYNFQKMKIYSSGLSEIFKEIIITEKDKSRLDLDYKNSIFIDNNPIEIEKLYNSGAKKIIRVKRDNDRYAEIQCNISGIIECSDFKQIVQILNDNIINKM